MKIKIKGKEVQVSLFQSSDGDINLLLNDEHAACLISSDGRVYKFIRSALKEAMRGMKK